MNVSPRAIHHLNCGSMCPRGARVLNGEGGLLERALVPCHCLLIEGADGLVLIDTGFGISDVAEPSQLGRMFTAAVSPRCDRGETAIEQIRALGLDPADVAHIVTTHLDLDHAGGLPDFPAAQVHLLARELSAAMSPGLRERARYVRSHWAHGPKWVTHEPGGDSWMGMESVTLLPGGDDEILLIPLVGHTAGHTGVAVRRGEGWLLHCGDAYFDHGEVQTPPRRNRALDIYQDLLQVDGRARRANRERLRELAAAHAGELELLCSHDVHTLRAHQGAGAGHA